MQAYMKWHNKPHKSHKMGKAYSEILAPCGTPRFYAVRDCKLCGAGQAEHAAGRFCDPELLKECKKVKTH
jgi:hypothetical protein